MIRRVLQTGLISVFLAACNVATPIPPTTTSTPRPTTTPTHTITPSPVPTATPVILNLKVIKDLVNCRSGPGMVYELINELKEDQVVSVVGRDEPSTWWYIRDPGNPGGVCWVSADVSKIDGDAGQLPVVQSPATNVTGLELIVAPKIITVSCFQFPQTFFFEARVTADGPLIVLWQWEANTGELSTTGTLVFEQAGTNIINYSYQVDAANDYWIKLNILSPAPLTKQVNFRAICS